MRVAREGQVVGIAGIGRAQAAGEAGQALVQPEGGEVRKRGRGRRALRQVAALQVIAGGKADQISRRRLTMLLSTYVVAMSVTFGTIGLLASLGGESMSAAFQSPTAIWIISGIFASTTLTLFVIPLLYYMANRRRMEKAAA